MLLKESGRRAYRPTWRGWLRSQGSGAASTNQVPRLPGSEDVRHTGPSASAASAPPAKPPRWPLHSPNRAGR